jgi:hypothetical protein
VQAFTALAGQAIYEQLFPSQCWPAGNASPPSPPGLSSSGRPQPETTTLLLLVQVVPLASDVSSNGAAGEAALAAVQGMCAGLLTDTAAAVLQLQLGAVQAAAPASGSGCTVTRSTAGDAYGSLQGGSSRPLWPRPPPTGHSMPPLDRLDYLMTPPPPERRAPAPSLPSYAIAVLAAGSSLVVLCLVVLVTIMGVVVFRWHKAHTAAGLPVLPVGTAVPWPTVVAAGQQGPGMALQAGASSLCWVESNH